MTFEEEEDKKRREVMDRLEAMQKTDREERAKDRKEHLAALDRFKKEFCEAIEATYARLRPKKEVPVPSPEELAAIRLTQFLSAVKQEMIVDSHPTGMAMYFRDLWFCLPESIRSTMLDSRDAFMKTAAQVGLPAEVQKSPSHREEWLEKFLAGMRSMEASAQAQGASSH